MVSFLITDALMMIRLLMFVLQTPSAGKWDETPGRSKASDTPGRSTDTPGHGNETPGTSRGDMDTPGRGGVTPSTRIWEATPSYIPQGAATPTNIGAGTPGHGASKKDRLIYYLYDLFVLQP